MYVVVWQLYMQRRERKSHLGTNTKYVLRPRASMRSDVAKGALWVLATA